MLSPQRMDYEDFFEGSGSFRSGGEKRRRLHIAQYDFAVQMKPLPPDGEAILSELSKDRILHIHW